MSLTRVTDVCVTSCHVSHASERDMKRVATCHTHMHKPVIGEIRNFYFYCYFLSFKLFHGEIVGGPTGKRLQNVVLVEIAAGVHSMTCIYHVSRTFVTCGTWQCVTHTSHRRNLQFHFFVLFLDL